ARALPARRPGIGGHRHHAVRHSAHCLGEVGALKFCPHPNEKRPPSRGRFHLGEHHCRPLRRSLTFLPWIDGLNWCTSSVAVSPVAKRHGSSPVAAYGCHCMKCARCAQPLPIGPATLPSWFAPTRFAPTTRSITPSACCMRRC